MGVSGPEKKHSRLLGDDHTDSYEDCTVSLICGDQRAGSGANIEWTSYTYVGRSVKTIVLFNLSYVTVIHPFVQYIRLPGCGFNKVFR